MPVLARVSTEETPEPAREISDVPGYGASTGTGDGRSVLAIEDLPVGELPVLTPGASTGTHAGWRVERFGPPGGDGKGRYWQWRKGRGKERTSAYGGKVGNEAAEYWHHRNSDTHGHAQGNA